MVCIKTAPAIESNGEGWYHQFMSLIKNKKIYKIMLGQQSKFYKECVKEGYIGVNYNISLELNEGLDFSQKGYSKLVFPN